MFNLELGGEQIKISFDPDGDGSAESNAFDTVRLTSLDLDLGFNLKRDPNAVLAYYDEATQDKPYQFWLNDDHDTTGGGTAQGDATDVPVDANNPPDSQDNQISNLRDMEDFTVFQIDSRFQFLADLGTDYKLIFKFTETNGTNPSLKLYLSDSSLHLIHFTESARSFANDHYFGEVTTSSAVELPLDLLSDSMFTSLLFEGFNAGQGALTLQLKKGEQIIADAKGYLDLRPITQLYDHYTVGDTETMDWNQIPLTDTQIQSAVANPHSPENPDYVLFVHGWRMLTNERRSYAETAYKRMFWQGYNGGFGLFSWPTEYTSNPEVDQENYDRSERKAYWSGWGLHGALEQLNQQYPGKVDVFAHSMGNIVVSEALRIEATSQSPERIVDVYVASQAASVAHAYDANRPATETDESTQTPEVYASYPPTGQPYYGTIDLAANKLVNFYNPQDYALGVGWMANQDTKPDGAWDYDSDGWFRDGLLVNTYLFFPNDRYEIFAHIAEARSLALGAQSGVEGPFTTAEEVNLDSVHGFGGGSTTSHSAQFLSTLGVRGAYWGQLLYTFGATL